MPGISINAKVDRIQLPENLRYSRLLRQQEQHCAAMGCTAEPYRFGLGQSPFPVPGELQQIICGSEPVHAGRYPEPAGLPELRAAVARAYGRQIGRTIDPGRVFIGPGAKSLIFSIFTLLAGSVVIPSPGWLGYLPMLRILNVPYYRMYTNRAYQYKIRAPELRALLRGLVKTQHLLILNNPSNPTGVLYTREELEAIAEVCREFKTLVLADEVTGPLVYDQQQFVSMGSLYPEGTFVIGSLSFAYSAGGYRVGSVIIPEESDAMVVQELEKILATLYTGAATPMQYAALSAFRDPGTSELALSDVREIHRIMTTRTAALCSGIEGIRVTRPAGGFCFMADLNPITEALQQAGIFNSNLLAPALISHPYHIAAVTGEAMMAPYLAYYVRFAVNDYNGEEALAAFRASRPSGEAAEEAFFRTHGARMIEGIATFRQWVEDVRSGRFVLTLPE